MVVKKYFEAGIRAINFEPFHASWKGCHWALSLVATSNERGKDD